MWPQGSNHCAVSAELPQVPVEWQKAPSLRKRHWVPIEYHFITLLLRHKWKLASFYVLLTMFQSLNGCFCFCVCVLGVGMFVILWKNRDLMSSEHANLILFCFAQLTLSIGQDWGYEKIRVSCHECRILSAVNVVFHFFWECLSIW